MFPPWLNKALAEEVISEKKRMVGQKERGEKITADPLGTAGKLFGEEMLDPVVKPFQDIFGKFLLPIIIVGAIILVVVIIK